jgi:hypothetical protein
VCRVRERADVLQPLLWRVLLLRWRRRYLALVVPARGSEVPPAPA